LWVWTEEKRRLFGAVASRFRSRTGGGDLSECVDGIRLSHPRRAEDGFVLDYVIERYVAVAKSNFSKSRDRKLIRPDEDDGFFGGENGVSVVLYAYLGMNNIAHRRLVKLGFTSQPINEYMNDLRRAHDPWLLATFPGGRQEEGQLHVRWSRILREGREWFEPSEELLDWLYWNFVTEPDFLQKVERYRESNGRV